MKRLLIVVDYQKDFVDGALGFPGAEALDGPIADTIAQYRTEGGDVIFTMDTHGADYAATVEGRHLPEGVARVAALRTGGGLPSARRSGLRKGDLSLPGSGRLAAGAGL